LAITFAISRTPVVRALERLAGEGLVEFKPGQGPFVSAPTVPEIVELYEARTMCEISVVWAGIGRVDDDYLTEMDRLIQANESAIAARDESYDSLRVSATADRQIHLHIVSLWPNTKIIAWYKQLNAHIRSFQLALPALQRAESLQEHRDVYNALCRRDALAAAGAVHLHGQAAKEAFLHRVEMASSKTIA
jgi:DNA-binding GntR family transcriptional regulator